MPLGPQVAAARRTLRPIFEYRLPYKLLPPLGESRGARLYLEESWIASARIFKVLYLHITGTFHHKL
jgi:hypothetical protein